MENRTVIIVRDIPQVLQDVEDWLKKTGIKFDNSRLRYAKTVYERWHQTREVPRNDELWILCELMDFIEFYNYFSQEKLDPAKLKMIISGCNLLADESDTTARDYQFEWKIASRFKRAGFILIENPDHDVVAECEGYKLYIECKRVKNYQKMHKRIKKAYKQLASVDNRSQHGAIFLDLSRIVYFSHIKSTKPLHIDEKTLNEWRDSYDLKLKNMIEEQHLNILNDVRLFVIYYSFPVFIEGESVKLNHFLSLTNTDDDQLVERMINSVGNA